MSCWSEEVLPLDIRNDLVLRDVPGCNCPDILLLRNVDSHGFERCDALALLRALPSWDRICFFEL